jgi:hypothetical protein
MMTIADEIYLQVKILPESMAREVLTFIEFLQFKANPPNPVTGSHDRWQELVQELAGAWPDMPTAEELRKGWPDNLPRESL